CAAWSLVRSPLAFSDLPNSPYGKVCCADGIPPPGLASGGGRSRPPFSSVSFGYAREGSGTPSNDADKEGRANRVIGSRTPDGARPNEIQSALGRLFVRV